MCDKDCFNCTHEDCILETLTKSDFDEQQERDFEFGGKKHSTEKHKETSKRYYWEHHEEMLIKHRNYYATHKDKFKEYDRVRKQTHPVSPEKRHEYYVRWRDKKRRENNANQ